MTSAQATVNRRGIGFVGALTLIFAVAKVFGFSNMSWLWVFSPLWIAAGITIAILVVLFLGALTIDWVSTRGQRKRVKARRKELAKLRKR